MNKMTKKAFTLIELIAVLVILAVIALIVTPLVLNIIKSTKKSANERSVDEYGKAVELAAASYLLDTGKKANSFDVLNVEYSGNEVKCNVSEVYKNNVFLSQCSVNGKEVKSSKTSDGYYQYGDATKFLGMYGDAVKKAIVRYQKDNNEMPAELSELAINADGLNISCNSSRINSDGTVYLSECSLNNVLIKDYHYGISKYLIGDIITYNGMNFYVIVNSDEESDYVTLLKAEPIKASEVDLSGTEISAKVSESNDGYISSAYLYSDTCVSAGFSNGTTTGCTTDYKLSSIKQVVDAWTADKFKSSDLKEDNLGYKVRLITFDELVDNLGYGDNGKGTIKHSENGYTPDWACNSKYNYWTMSPYEDSNFYMWYVYHNGSLNYESVERNNVVRPVVNLRKSAIEME